MDHTALPPPELDLGSDVGSNSGIPQRQEGRPPKNAGGRSEGPEANTSKTLGNFGEETEES